MSKNGRNTAKGVLLIVFSCVASLLLRCLFPNSEAMPYIGIFIISVPLNRGFRLLKCNDKAETKSAQGSSAGKGVHRSPVLARGWLGSAGITIATITGVCFEVSEVYPGTIAAVCLSVVGYIGFVLTVIFAVMVLHVLIKEGIYLQEQLEQSQEES